MQTAGVVVLGALIYDMILVLVLGGIIPHRWPRRSPPSVTLKNKVV